MKAKISGQINIPCEIKVDDYHEFGTIQYYLDQIIPGTKVKEIGFDEQTCIYVGMVYQGALKQYKNKDLWKYLKNKVRSNREN